MPYEDLQLKNGMVRYWNFTTTKFTPNVEIFRVLKVGKLWVLNPKYNCPEYVPFHKTCKAALKHYEDAWLPIDKLPKTQSSR